MIYESSDFRFFRVFFSIFLWFQFPVDVFSCITCALLYFELYFEGKLLADLRCRHVACPSARNVREMQWQFVVPKNTHAFRDRWFILSTSIANCLSYIFIIVVRTRRTFQPHVLCHITAYEEHYVSQINTFNKKFGLCWEVWRSLCRHSSWALRRKSEQQLFFFSFFGGVAQALALALCGNSFAALVTSSSFLTQLFY